VRQQLAGRITQRNWSSLTLGKLAALRLCFRFLSFTLRHRSAMQQWSVDYPAGLDWDQNWTDYVEATKHCVGDPSHLFPVAETPHASVYALGPRVFNCHISDKRGPPSDGRAR
jgi:hypothetical protein